MCVRETEANLVYIVSFRLAEATGNPCLQKKEKERKVFKSTEKQLENPVML